MLSTLVHASDEGYRVIVIDDCCTDLDTELHGVLIKNLFPKRADVVTAREFVETLNLSQ